MIKNIAVIGLGYVGLPLAVEFAKKYPTVGLDINPERVQQLQSGEDKTLEIESDVLSGVVQADLKSIEQSQSGLFCTTNARDLAESNFYIVTVPTPTDKNKNPVLAPLIAASKLLANFSRKGTT